MRGAYDLIVAGNVSSQYCMLPLACLIYHTLGSPRNQKLGRDIEENTRRLLKT